MLYRLTNRRLRYSARIEAMTQFQTSDLEGEVCKVVKIDHKSLPTHSIPMHAHDQFVPERRIDSQVADFPRPAVKILID